MGLKEVYVSVNSTFELVDKIRPKWDWKMSKINTMIVDFPIKSDQNGIESVILLFYGYTVSYPDKIRPKWDWKHESVNRTVIKYIMIKSDQNGIERERIMSSRKQYYLEIKSDQNGIESGLVTSVWVNSTPDKIRPKWDWKETSGAMQTLPSSWIKSDQNGIEREK